MTDATELANHIVGCLSPQGLKGLKIMLGANRFVTEPGALSFRFKGNRRMNHVNFRLNGSDTFDLTFGLVRNGTYATVEEINDVQVEQLAETFREATGLETRVPTIVT